MKELLSRLLIDVHFKRYVKAFMPCFFFLSNWHRNINFGLHLTFSTLASIKESTNPHKSKPHNFTVNNSILSASLQVRSLAGLLHPLTTAPHQSRHQDHLVPPSSHLVPVPLPHTPSHTTALHLHFLVTSYPLPFSPLCKL